MEQEFYDYLIGKDYTHSTTNSYKSAINSISKNYSQRIGKEINIYEIQEQDEINRISQEYSQNGDYANVGNNRNGTWRCAIARYSEFFANRDNVTINKIKQESTYEDNQIISTLGVKMCASPLNQILYGPPGTGKTYSTVNKALDILLGENHNSDINSIGKLKEKFGSQVEFVTFHQSFSYEDFIEGLKAKTDDGKLSYEVENGVFKQICENAENNGNNSLEELNKAIEKLKEQVAKEPLKLITSARKKPFTLTYNGNKAFYAKPEAGEYKNPVSIDSIIKLYKNPNIKNGDNGVYFKPYTIPVIEHLKDNDFDLSNYQETIDKEPHVLIIDEINRGNISRIFGELITLIEPSKRAGESEVISVKLPYSKEDFSVPNNLYIIGTMNTADRSLTMMDTALRRRFDFIEMAPDVGLVKGDFDGINVGKILEFINKRIEILYDREHLIGHSFLMGIDDLRGLRNAFKNKILPLLEEYFYDDFENIRKVLNDKEEKFYKETKVDESLFFGNENIQKDSYEKVNIDELTAEYFQQIYKNKDE